MDQDDGSELPPTQSYPSPTPQQMGVANLSYYAAQQELSPEEQLQQQLSGGASSGMTGDMASNQNMMEPGQAPQQFDQKYDPQSNSPQIAVGQYDTSQPGEGDLQHDPTYGDISGRRKRSKVSRACDECRRKKIRCDATNESGHEKCSNCSRTSQQCQFSRVPMKRGPSKGYIKELAERLNSLEHQMQPAGDIPYQGMNEEGSPHNFEPYSPMDAGSLSRKRTFSAVDSTPASYTGQFQQRDRMSSTGGWSNQGQSGPVFQQQRPYFAGPSNAIQPEQEETPPFWLKGNMDSAALEATEGVPTNPDFKWDVESIEAYYKSIHPLLPILPNSRDDLRALLNKGSLRQRDTFLHFLYATVRGRSRSRHLELLDETSTKHAFECLRDSQNEDSKNRSVSVNLIHFQCMILAILDADQRGPDGLRGNENVPSKIQLLQLAVSLGSSMVKLYILETSLKLDRDPHSILSLIRRNWIVLIILDRFHALGTGSMKLITNTKKAFDIDDKAVLGDQLWFLVELTDIMSSIIDVIDWQRSFPPGFSVFRSSRPFVTLLESELDRCHRCLGIRPIESAEETFGNPNFDTYHIVWWHLVLMLKRHLFIWHPSEILIAARLIADVLKKQKSSGPFHIHFFALTAITLLELTDIPELEEEARAAVSVLVDALNQRQNAPSSPSSRPQSPKTTNGGASGESPLVGEASTDPNATPAWDNAIQNLISLKLGLPDSVQSDTPPGAASAPTGAGRSLQQLADLAEKVGTTTGGEGAQDGPTAAGPSGTKEDKSATNGPAAIDFTALTRAGYLTVLA